MNRLLCRQLLVSQHKTVRYVDKHYCMMKPNAHITKKHSSLYLQCTTLLKNHSNVKQSLNVTTFF